MSKGLILGGDKEDEEGDGKEEGEGKGGKEEKEDEKEKSLIGVGDSETAWTVVSSSVARDDDDGGGGGGGGGDDIEDDILTDDDHNLLPTLPSFFSQTPIPNPSLPFTLSTSATTVPAAVDGAVAVPAEVAVPAAADTITASTATTDTIIAVESSKDESSSVLLLAGEDRDGGIGGESVRSMGVVRRCAAGGYGVAAGVGVGGGREMMMMMMHPFVRYYLLHIYLLVQFVLFGERGVVF